MSSSGVDFDSELGDTYMRLRREYRAGGKQPHWRPAANRDERLRAQEVNRKVNASIFGWRPAAPEIEMDAGTPARLRARCAHCGERLRPGTARLWRQVWGEHGGCRLDVWVHAGGCPSSQRERKQQ